MLLSFINGELFMRVNNARQYERVRSGSIIDITYPHSPNRRGRIQDGGQICGALMAGIGDVVYIEWEQIT